MLEFINHIDILSLLLCFNQLLLDSINLWFDFNLFYHFKHFGNSHLFSKVQQKMQDELELLKERQSDVDDENDKLQAILEVKDNLLKAQADQIAALRSVLEKQMNPPSESEKENDLTADHIEPAIQISLNSTGTEAVSEDMPTFFEEIQQLIVSMLHKVDRSARALEAAQWSKQKTSLVVSPRNLNTPSTSTEDISIKYIITFNFVANLFGLFSTLAMI